LKKGVAEFVRRSRRRVTSKLVPIIYDRLSGKPLFLSKESDPGDTKRRLEEWLRRMGPAEIDTTLTSNTVRILMDGDESEGETSSSDDGIVEEKSIPNLQLLKIFLLGSKAFEQLQIGIEAMVTPKETHSKMPAMQGFITSVPEMASFQVSWRCVSLATTTMFTVILT
jgi:hypothetical protein